MNRRFLTRIFLCAALVIGGAVPALAQTIEYYHLDAAGSVRAVTDESGELLARHDYLPFGVELDTAPTQPIRFSGKERDSETGLHYFGARYYDASVGRFSSVDPVMTLDANLADPQRWNRYAHVRNNPLRYQDPDGRAIETGWDALNVGIGVASLAGNVAAGNIGGAALDVVGVAIDAGATVIPGVPGGAGTLIKGYRASDKATDGLRMALGLSQHPNHRVRGLVGRFADHVNAKTYWDFFPGLVDDFGLAGKRVRELLERAKSIHFNLDGLTVNSSLDEVLDAGRGGLAEGSFTNWELFETVANPNFFDKTTYYNDAKEFLGVTRDLLR